MATVKKNTRSTPSTPRMTVVFLGCARRCQLSAKLVPLKNSKLFAAWVAEHNVEVVGCDYLDSRPLYTQWKAKLKFSGAWPMVYVLDGAGVVKGSFLARAKADLPDFTPAGLIAKIESICPACSCGTCSDEPETACPNCKGTGKIACPQCDGTGKA